MRYSTLFALTSVIVGFIPANAHHSPVSAAFKTPVYQELPLGAVKPRGWLLHQLQIMRDGSSGHLDEVHNKIKNDNGWLGGKGEAWEETPYWLDGAVPLAYLLDDTALKQKVLRYINWTLDHQRPSGYFGPITKAEREKNIAITVNNPEAGEDWWPKMVMLKVLQQYYTATGDSRVVPFLKKYFQYQLQVLKKCPIGQWTEWATSRGADNALVVQWLYRQTKDPSLLELAALIHRQSYPWTNWLGNRNWVIDAAAQQDDHQWMRRHGVNVAMGLKDPAINYQRTGDRHYLDSLHTGFHDLMTLHGLPMGIFSADEDLHGNAPTQGTELCAIVESMFSLEEIIGITGDIRYMDALERMTFNALPTQTTDDYNNKQYFQIANQVQVKKGVFNFSLPFERGMNNVYGLRSGYTCCTANMHQGWTKFASHLWYAAADQGLAALSYSPSEVTAKVGRQQQPVTIVEETAYPFDDQVSFTFRTSGTVEFPLQLRIPAWCREAVITLNGQPLRREKGGQVITLQRAWKNKDQLVLQLPMEVTVSAWGRNSRAVERGPLVYALKLGERWEKAVDEQEGEYFSIFPEGAWNFGLLEKAVKAPVQNFTVHKGKPVTPDFVWNLEHAPVSITTSARKIPAWQLADDVAPQPVTAREGTYKGQTAAEEETITLVPYGCTKVRVVAFPVVR
ncbi:glycoside hydrolase family 127 protein [Chitinophaga oryzae]|uniref:Glycoside hydrolase family 127 protein n=1 Tax=Chitinophaga oryzae TaxID=2725414 RepID=A0AAE7D886_9BACT|nr:beta-L-arabinofuranosidase domain-containing protein [Chitinophaga oryzae]QJB33152.1 glycoside hydrolase family 127 protein [Chitinophaga oryzae]QJB39628.1 glycoside hydrolase family 127 protein [Chitinophaga oryzae]